MYLHVQYLIYKARSSAWDLPSGTSLASIKEFFKDDKFSNNTFIFSDDQDFPVVILEGKKFVVDFGAMNSIIDAFPANGPIANLFLSETIYSIFSTLSNVIDIKDVRHVLQDSNTSLYRF